MANLPLVRRIMREDFKDAPTWLDRLIDTINMFFDSVYTALNKNLTFGDNIRAQIKTIQLTAGASATDNTFSFLTTVPRPQGVIVLSAVQSIASYTPIADAVTVPSWTAANGTVNIDSITGLTSGSIYNITLLVI